MCIKHQYTITTILCNCINCFCIFFVYKSATTILYFPVHLGIIDHGKIAILVNVAGLFRERMIWNMTEEDFDLVVSVHLKGHWTMSHHAIKHMRMKKFGRIVNFSSDAFKGSVGQCNYSAAKAGVIGATRDLAGLLSPLGVRVNAISPGGFERGQPQALVDAYSRATPMGRMGRDGVDLKGAALFLASDASAYVTGQNLTVDGGFAIWK